MFPGVDTILVRLTQLSIDRSELPLPNPALALNLACPLPGVGVSQGILSVAKPGPGLLCGSIARWKTDPGRGITPEWSGAVTVASEMGSGCTASLTHLLVLFWGGDGEGGDRYYPDFWPLKPWVNLPLGLTKFDNNGPFVLILPISFARTSKKEFNFRNSSCENLLISLVVRSTELHC